MKKEQKSCSRVRMILGIFLCLTAILFGTVSVQAEELEVSIFYDNACAACKEDEELEELYRNSVPQELREKSELRIYNIFEESNRRTFEEVCGETGVSSQGMTLPAMNVGNSWLYGTDEIAEKAAMLIESGGVSDENRSDGVEIAPAEAEETSGEALPAGLSEALNTGKAPLVLFTTYSCEACAAVKTYLDEIVDQRDLPILEYNIAEGTNVQMIRSWFGAYGVESSSQQVPIIFYGDKYLSGEEEICSGMEALLDDVDNAASLMQSRLDDYNVTELSDEIPNLAVLFGSGLLAGFNPCSISMLLMLFSVILTAQASVRKNGLLYLGGKYVTYLGIGLGIYFAASVVTQSLLDRVMGMVKIVLVVLFLAVAVLNFVDFYNVRKGNLGKIRMQLPAGLRRWNHRLIRRVQGLSGGLLSLVVLGLGVVISIGEFFCTGQIYMASILYMLRQGSAPALYILTAFLIYVTAMCIPAVVFLFVIAKTRSINRISEFMLRRMDLVKMLNGILFSGFAFYFLIFG